MTKPSEELNKKRGDRVKELFKWWNALHPEQKKTQAELADTMSGRNGKGISAIALNAKLNNGRTLTEKDAREIAAYFPGSRFEFIMCYDDYMTDSEKFGAVISDMQDEAHLLLLGLNAFSKLCDYQISAASPVRTDPAPVGEVLKAIREGYTIRKDDRTVRLSLEEMNDFENEVCDFVELKLKHLFKQKGERDNG